MTVEPSRVRLQRRGTGRPLSPMNAPISTTPIMFSRQKSSRVSGATKEEASSREYCYMGARFVPVYTGLFGRVLLSFSIHGDANPPIKAELILRANVSHNAYNRAHNA